MSRLENEIANISDSFAEKQKRFDSVMDSSRALIRGAGVIITMLHNGKIEEAKRELKKASAVSKSLKSFEPEFEYNTKQAQQEYAEARIFFSLKVEKAIPSMGDLDVGEEPYLMGLMDVVGELKRELVSALSDGNRKYAEYCHSMMLEIFDSTRSIRFAEAVLPGFRKKQDVARIQIESSSSDLLHNKR